MNRILSRTMVLAVAGVLTLSACSQDDSASFGADTGAGQSSETGAGGSSGGDGAENEGDDTGEQSAAAAEITVADLGDPIVTATVPAVVELDPDATMEVSLYSLTRDGETLHGVFSFLVTSENGADDAQWLYDYLGATAWEPHLIDPVNLARHDVLGDHRGRAMTDYQGAKFRPGQTFYAYASFAAPPTDVTSITVSLTDGAPAAAQVPIR